MPCNRFRVSRAFVFQTKWDAKRKAKELRSRGYRAVVRKSSKTTRKERPDLKWVVFMGQKRRGW